MDNKDLIMNDIQKNINNMIDEFDLDVNSKRDNSKNSKEFYIENIEDLDELYKLSNKEFAKETIQILEKYMSEDILDILVSDERSKQYTKHLRAILKDVTDINSEEKLNEVACAGGDRLRYYKDPIFEIYNRKYIVSNDWYYQTHNNYDNRTPFISFIRNIIESNSRTDMIPSYTKNDFLDNVFISERKYNTIVSLLCKKKNIILQGAPGVGKTYIAKRLVYSIMEKVDNSKVEFIQFHQSYSYEDFVEGYRPTENGFELKKGIFYTFCKKAKLNPDENYYLIIDEINRGNLSKIFGELLMLIENDKRGTELRLEYSEELFSVPKNLYIIGLMNTADRSLALIDYALRRRFSFITIEPAFNNKEDKNGECYNKFINKYHSIFGTNHDNVIELIKELNNAIQIDPSLGEGFMIGHSYFCSNIENGNKEDLNEILEYDIKPLLEEYWYDDEIQKNEWINKIDALISEV